MIVLPALAFVLLFLILRKKQIAKRRALLVASTFWGAGLVLMTELLSVFQLITRGAVAISWLAVNVVCLIVYLKLERPASTPDSHSQPADADSGSEGLDTATRVLMYVTGIIVVLVGITALVAPPSGIDAMTYHLPRAAMWINNHNVRFFPTPNYPQIIYGSFAEYSIMHTMLLWGNDRFANMIQFFSFIGCAIAAAYITKLMGASARTQALAALISITIPEGILEASGSMNTYAGAYWIVATAAFILAFNEEPTWLNAVCVGLAAGLAVFTKGTTYIMLPFIVLACWWMGSRASRIVFLKRSALFILLILAINLPQYIRNYKFDGSPLGVPLDYGEIQLTVENIGVRSTIANTLRNISLHTVTPFDSVNSKVEHGFRAAIKAVGVDPDDHRQVIWREPFLVNHLSFQELLAGNPWHFFLIVIATAILFVKYKDPENRQAFRFAAGLVIAFVVFSAIVKWQRWNTRFQLPLFVLGAVILALVLVRYFPRKVVTALAAALVCCGLLYASMNRFRSLIPGGRWQTVYQPRSELYFAYNMDYLAPSYIALSEAVNKIDCASIGIDAYTPLPDPEIMRSPDSFYAYPIFSMLHADGRTRKVWYAGVHNLTKRYAESQPQPAPCAIICLDCAKAPVKWEEYRSFPNHRIFENAVVFTDANTVLDRR